MRSPFLQGCVDLATLSLPCKRLSLTYVVMVAPIVLLSIPSMTRARLSIGTCMMVGSLYDHTGQNPMLKAQVSESSRRAESEVTRTPEDGSHSYYGLHTI